MAEQQQFDAGLMDKFPAFSMVPPGCPDYGHPQRICHGLLRWQYLTALWNYAQRFAMSDNSSALPSAALCSAISTWCQARPTER
jgi:hypothetical protein